MRFTLLLCLALGCTTNGPPPIDPSATVRFVTAPQGDVAPLLVAQLARSSAERRRVVVYVSAPWCEPCRVFHEAVERGEMTGKIGPLDLVAFDAEPDAERLVMAGYESQFIPAFTVPNADGRASARHMEGSVKGPGATSDLAPRLRELVLASPAN